MGNCCLERPRRGGGAGGVHYARTNPVWVEEDTKEEARKGKGAGHAPAATTSTGVKIRISRRQLEELLRRVEDGKQGGGGGAPVEEVISELLCAANNSSTFRHRDRREEGQWRPSLQTIPE